MDLSVVKTIFEDIGAFLSPLSSLVTILAGSGMITVLWRWISINRKSKRLKLDKIKRIVNPIIGSKDIIKDLIETKYYIPIMVSENEDEDEDEDETKKNLADELVNEWKSKSQVKKRYLVFGGSGTGKTTFMAALIYKYIYSCRVNKEPYTIILLRLGSPNVLDEITNITNPEKTILLLDALDENRDAISDICGFMDKLGQITKDYFCVVVTSRKQVFDSDDDIPTELSILGLTGGLHWYQYFILPFSMDEVKNYLSIKFNTIKDYHKAYQIVDKTSNLISRAMILSFIDNLLDIDPDNITKSQLYKEIIDKWLDRELCTISKKERPQYIKNYYVFSKLLAKTMYDNWTNHRTLSVPYEQFENLKDKNGHLFPTKGYPFKIRSVVERNGDQIVFAHKSFWEFFIAIYAVENPGKSFVLIKSDNAQSFANELYLLSVRDIKFEEIQYYKPILEEKNIIQSDLLSIIEKNERVCEQSTDNEKEEIYISTLWKLYRYICLRSDYDRYYSYSQYGIMQALNTRNIHLLCMNLICNALISKNLISGDHFSYIRKTFKLFPTEPVCGFPYARKKIVIYRFPSKYSADPIFQNLSCCQIWFADCSSSVNSLLKEIHSFLKIIRPTYKYHYISTICIIKDVDKNQLFPFVHEVITEMNKIINSRSDKIYGHNVLLSLKVQNTVVPLLITRHFVTYMIETDKLSAFLNKILYALRENNG